VTYIFPPYSSSVNRGAPAPRVVCNPILCSARRVVENSVAFPAFPQLSVPTSFLLPPTSRQTVIDKPDEALPCLFHRNYHKEAVMERVAGLRPRFRGFLVIDEADPELQLTETCYFIAETNKSRHLHFVCWTKASGVYIANGLCAGVKFSEFLVMSSLRNLVQREKKERRKKSQTESPFFRRRRTTRVRILLSARETRWGGGEEACSDFIRISGLLSLDLPSPSSPPSPLPLPPPFFFIPRVRRLPLRSFPPTKSGRVVYLIFEILPFYFYPRDFIHFAD